MSKFKSISILIVILLMTPILSSCLEDPDWIPKSDTPTPQATLEATPIPEVSHTESPSPTPEPTPEPTPTPTPTPEPTPTPTPSPTPEPTPPDISSLPNNDLGAANYTEASDQLSYISNHLGSDLPFVEEYCAYIVGKSMSMDGQTDIVFDYVEWLSNPEATEAYLEDNPGAAPEDYEFIDYVGYIRNVDPATVVLRTSPNTRYFLNRPAMSSQIGEVDYDEFRDWLFPLTEDAFVVVCAVDGVVARVEWIFLP